MDKRTFVQVDSPTKLSSIDARKKFKESTSPKKPEISENNANVLNSQEKLNEELDGLCFDDDEEDEKLRASVSKNCRRCVKNRLNSLFLAVNIIGSFNFQTMRCH